MDKKVAEEFLDELFSSLEALDTQSAAILQFLKVQGEVTDEELAPFLEQASKASNVRWRATRLRLMSLFSSAVKSSEESAQKSAKPSEQEQQASEPLRKHGETRPAEQKPAEPKAEETAQAAKHSDQPSKAPVETQRKATAEQEPKTSGQKEPEVPSEQKPEASSEERQSAEKSSKGDRGQADAPPTAPQGQAKKDAA